MQYGSDGIRFSTIHSLCYSVLARAYNLKAEDILSEAGRLKFFTEFHRQLLYKEYQGFLMILRSIIENVMNT